MKNINLEKREEKVNKTKIELDKRIKYSTEFNTLLEDFPLSNVGKEELKSIFDKHIVISDDNSNESNITQDKSLGQDSPTIKKNLSDNTIENKLSHKTQMSDEDFSKLLETLKNKDINAFIEDYTKQYGSFRNFV